MKGQTVKLETLLCQTKEQFPRIYERIELLWGYPELNSYLNKLMVSDRAEKRAGFPFEVIKELVSIPISDNTNDIWALNFS